MNLTHHKKGFKIKHAVCIIESHLTGITFYRTIWKQEMSARYSVDNHHHLRVSIWKMGCALCISCQDLSENVVPIISSVQYCLSHSQSIACMEQLLVYETTNTASQTDIVSVWCAPGLPPAHMREAAFSHIKGVCPVWPHQSHMGRPAAVTHQQRAFRDICNPCAITKKALTFLDWHLGPEWDISTLHSPSGDQYLLCLQGNVMETERLYQVRGNTKWKNSAIHIL